MAPALELSDGRGPTAGSVDLMNGRLISMRLRIERGSIGELDTCRICRGEGSKEEPLFHPCKCSGSIKHVHQECLMEWLSHSHKKYCELCKTHFRFTKLYDPQMPRSIPLPIILRQAVSQTAKSLVAWSRCLLVGLVWLGWLPWSMRACWRFLFWLGDGGWAARDVQVAQARPSTRIVASAVRGQLPDPSSPLRNLVGLLSLGGTEHPTDTIAASPNTDSGYTPFYALVNDVLVWLGQAGQSSTSALPTANDRRLMKDAGQRSTLLSDVTYLNSLTPSTTLNKLIIDVLEGQIITLLVVLAFVLVFLIREWVVQQQFGINPGLDLENAFVRPDQPNNGAPHELDPDPRPTDEAVIGRVHPTENLRRDSSLEAARSRGVGNANGAMDDPSAGQTPTRALRIAATTALDEDRSQSNTEALPITSRIHTWNGARSGNHPTSQGAVASTSSSTSSTSTEMDGVATPTRRQRPRLPARSSSFAASQIRRLMEEESRMTVGLPTPEEVLKIWRRVDGHTEDFVRIVREGGRSVDLTWIVKALEVLQEVDGHDDERAEEDVGDTRNRTADGVDANRSGRISVRWGSSNSDRQNHGRQSHGHGKQAVRGRLAESPPTITSTTPTEEVERRPGYQSASDQTADDILFDYMRPVNLPSFTDVSDIDSSDADPMAADHTIFGYYQGPENAAPSTSSTHQRAEDDGTTREGQDSSPTRSHAHSDTWVTVGDDHSVPDSDHSRDVLSRPSVEDGQPGNVALQVQRRPSQTVVERVMDWCWGDLGPEHVLEQDFLPHAQEIPIEDLAPVVLDNEDHRELQQRVDAGDGDQQEENDPANQAIGPDDDPNRPGAIEEGEDLDGVMELIGLRGPLTGLFQNAILSAVLLSATIGGGIWIPYVWGKVVLVVLVHPFSLLVKLPLRWLSISIDLALDMSLLCAGSLVFWADHLVRLSLASLATSIPFLGRFSQASIVASTARLVARRSIQRIAKILVATSIEFSTADYPFFSVVAFESLTKLKLLLFYAFTSFSRPIVSLYQVDLGQLMTLIRLRALEWRSLPLSMSKLIGLPTLAVESFKTSFARSLASFKSVLTDPVAPSATILDEINPATIYWSATDRIIAIVAGYVVISIVGALYIKRGTFFSTSEQGRRLEAIIQSVLVQAGGILKVILIISVEMIAFPLYCGSLLDLALLPLFGEATFLSRIAFTLNSPWTSAFVHWFVGTCYMFHFALFVSMCRKILRKGVLYFIRDPDDPTFHPVRDVLERNVTSQLRKIAFSALVYGGLVIFCLGGIVWGLHRFIDGILPIRWSSDERVLEFPVDLLLYNFLMPSAVQFLQPADGLHEIYTWWFRRCARLLRLTSFLFGDREEDEEGHYIGPVWRRFWLRTNGDIHLSLVDHDHRTQLHGQDLDRRFIRDGRFVRTPGSDQVRVPKGHRAFIEINAADERLAGHVDDTNDSNKPGPDLYTKVYIPPMFVARICSFIVLIWLFAAVTGMGVTILPLACGRMVLSAILPDQVRMNDVYAISIGLYLLGGCAYVALRFQQALTWARRSVRFDVALVPPVLGVIGQHGLRTLTLLYTLAAFGFVLPGLFALLMELYLIIPAHTYLAAHERHIIDLIQDWALGVLYINLVGRFILWYPQSRPARALRAVVRHGWLQPDARLATRSIVLPATVAMVTAATVPLALGWLTIRLRLDQAMVTEQHHVYRYSYPLTLGLCLAASVVWYLGAAIERWKYRIRDDVYLIGQRLHNLGESRHGVRLTRAATAGR